MPLLKVEDVARVLNVTKRRVYELVEHPNPEIRLPLVRIGKRAIRFRPEDVEAWLAERYEAAS